MYYTGGEDGVYMRISKDGSLEAGDYEGAFPHIGEATFTPVVTKQFNSFNEAFTAAMEAGGKQFLVDMFSCSVPQPIYAAQRPTQGEKPSVMEQIRQARNSQKQTSESRPHEKGKNKGTPEL
jgi:hypothetical protein